MKEENKDTVIPKYPVEPFEPLSYSEEEQEIDEGVVSDLDNSDSRNTNFLAVTLRPPTPTTPDYTLGTYLPATNVSGEEQRNVAMMALQNNASAAPAPVAPLVAQRPNVPPVARNWAVQQVQPSANSFPLRVRAQTYNLSKLVPFK